MRLRLFYGAVGVALSLLPPQTPAEISPLVDKFQSTYHSSRTLRADFLEQYFDIGKLVRSDAGVAFFAKPGKMRWEYQSPESNLYLIDGKWSWFYVPADHTVTRIPAKQSSDARTPFALLAGQMKVSEVCKTVELDHSGLLKNVRGVALRCNFRGAKSDESASSSTNGHSTAGASSSALFELDPANAQLLRVLVVDPGGIHVEFQFTNWEFNPQLDAAMFRFQPEKGVAIVDGNLAALSSSAIPPAR